MPRVARARTGDGELSPGDPREDVAFYTLVLDFRPLGGVSVMEGHLVCGNSLQQLELTDSGPTARNLTFVNIAPRKTTPCLAHKQESNNATDRFGRSCITSARVGIRLQAL